MNKNILIILPRLSMPGGVSTFWNSLLLIFDKYEDLNIETLEVGGHSKNIFGPLLDQWRLHKKMKRKFGLVFINPSLGSRSFFRDGFFAKQLAKNKISFFVFFHGWNIDFQEKVDFKYKNFFMVSFGNAQKIFVLSEEFKNKIQEWGYKGKVVVETTHVDSMLIKNFSLHKKLKEIKEVKKIKILFLARLFKEKGIFELVEAFNLLLKKYNNIELYIAGDGDIYSKLQVMVEGESNIKLFGYVEGENKINLFSESHIYCLPSYSEGLPTSVLEAMAFALPVITTQVGGLKGFFEDEKMGYFIERKNSKDLADKIELLLLDREKIEKIAEYNYHYVKQKLLNTVAAERIYKEIKSTIEEDKSDG